jgi:hypothetical protein
VQASTAAYTAAVHAAAVGVAAVGLVWGVLAGEPRQDSVSDALDLYARGEHAAAVARNPGSLPVDALTGTAGLWIQEGPPHDVARRRLIAAALVLETLWAATRHPDNAFTDPSDCAPRPRTDDLPVSSCRAVPLGIAWACAEMSQTDAAHPATAWWWRASVGLLEDARAWAELTGTPRRGPQVPGSPLQREQEEGHLAHVELRVPGEPRWQLSSILSRAALGPRPVGSWMIRGDVLRDGTLAAPGGGSRTDRELAALAAEAPDLAGEIELHLAYRDIQRRRWRDALPRLERAETLTSEPLLLATAGYFAGFVHERLRRPADALAAYRRAHAHAPTARNLGVLYAAQLFLDNQRDEAHAVLNTLVRAEAEPYDLRTELERGSARFVPEHLARMREALR